MNCASFALGNVTTPAVPVDSGFAGADGVYGLFGFGLFSHAVTAIDATRGWLVIEPLNIPVSELPAKVRPH